MSERASAIGLATTLMDVNIHEQKGTTRTHRNRNPCNSFLMVKMASGMDHGRVRPTTTTTTTTNDVAQHGGHPATTKSCSLGLQHISLILDMHTMFN